MDSRSPESLPLALFQILLHLGHELIGRRAIDHPMIEGKAEVSHGTDRDRVINNNRALLHGPDAEDRDLRLMDDRRAEQAPRAAVVGDRKRAALHFIGI